MPVHLPERALAFAAVAHGDQRRKYSDDPYIWHPIAVANLVRSVPHTTEMIAAAYLHYVIEDTQTELNEIKVRFGDAVATLVLCLTDKSKPTDGNRKKRKAIDRDHLASAPPDAQTIKLADLIDNTSTIVKFDPDFAKVYLEEKRELLAVMNKGDPILMRRALNQLETAADFG